jgi:hypothetical protein|tara:strand:+ start:481 stop:726 length:246 start_codon:yes stop_codon:yes gene_type:complete
MPYIEKTGNRRIAEQLWQWEGVMHDPNIDGFNGFGCKKKIYEVYWQAKAAIENSPNYHEEEIWIQEQETKQAIKKLGGDVG